MNKVEYRMCRRYLISGTERAHQAAFRLGLKRALGSSFVPSEPIFGQIAKTERCPNQAVSNRALNPRNMRCFASSRSSKSFGIERPISTGYPRPDAVNDGERIPAFEHEFLYQFIVRKQGDDRQAPDLSQVHCVAVDHDFNVLEAFFLCRYLGCRKGRFNGLTAPQRVAAVIG